MVELQLIQVDKYRVVPVFEAVVAQVGILLLVDVNQFVIHNLVLCLCGFEEEQVRERGAHRFWYGRQTLHAVDDTQSQVSPVVCQPLEYLLQVAETPHIGRQIVDEQQRGFGWVFLPALLTLLLDGQQVFQSEFVSYVIFRERLERVVLERGKRPLGH